MSNVQSPSRKRLIAILNAKAGRNKSVNESIITECFSREEEKYHAAIADAIANGIGSFQGCKIVEPKLWEERYR